MKAIVLGLVLVAAVGAADDDKTQAVLRQIMKGQLDVIKHCVRLRGYPYRNIPHPHSPHRHAPVAFLVRSKNILTNLPANKRIIFDTVDVNVGGGYKTSDGTFTAPKSGYYVFSWTILTHAGKRFHTELIVDGTVKGVNFVDAGGRSTHHSGSQTVIVYMIKNQKAWLKVHGDHGFYMFGWHWSTFSSYLLREF